MEKAVAEHYVEELGAHSDLPNCVVILAGPSGGHLFPAVAFAEEFRRRYPHDRLKLVTGERASIFAARFNPKVFDEIIYLPDFPLPVLKDLGFLEFLGKLAWAFGVLLKIFWENKPVLCVGFGSYIAFPGVVLARWMKIPTLIHEQNRILGKATRELLKYADHAAMSFEESLQDLTGSTGRSVTGLPVRDSLREMRLKSNELPVSAGLFQILIVGGSQGAHKLNAIVLSAFSQLRDEEKTQIAVIHITGEKDWPWVTKRYHELKMHFKTYPFFERMEELYRNSHVAVTRAGANTLFELALFKMPAIVVPYPFAEGHQKDNALVFERQGAVIVRDEEQFTSEWLLEQIKRLRADDGERLKLARAIGSLATPDAAEKVVNLAEGLMKRKSCAKIS